MLFILSIVRAIDQARLNQIDATLATDNDNVMVASHTPEPDDASHHIVPLGKGTPTREELLVYYPAKFTWKQLKTFVNSG